MIRHSRRPGVGPGKTIAIYTVQQRGAQSSIDPALRFLRIRGINGQALGKFLARGFRRARQAVQMRPGRFRIDVIRGDRRYAAPVVDPSANQLAQRFRAEIRRRLNVHLRFEQQPGCRDGPEVILDRRRSHFSHARPRFRPEILHDDLLDVAVAIVQLAQRQERIDTFRARLADADQNTAGERHTGFSGKPDRLQARRRPLVGRPEVRSAARAQALGRALEHDALRH